MQAQAINRPFLAKTVNITAPIYKLLNFLAPVSDLLIRLWAANVFFKSGLTKIQSFDSTLQLFQYEYHVPLLPPEVAAYMATGAELGFSVLLALGLAGRFSALGLFILNIVAVISYPDLDIDGLRDHQLWGILLLAVLLHGPGRLSLDHLIGKYFRR